MNDQHAITPSSTILVTGGTGFVGSYVIKNLVEKGYKVNAFRRRRPLPFYLEASITERVNWIDGDIMDVTALEEIFENTDAVIHSAAIVSFRSEDREAMFRTNIGGTANLINAAIEKKIKRFIHVSSVAALGRNANGTPINEQQKWEESKPNSNYAVSKYHAEMEVWRGIAEGLNAVIVNPTTILGFGDWNHSSNALFKNMYNNFPWYTNGTNGFVDVEDVSEVIISLLESNIHSERFILNGENWSYRKLLNNIADGFSKKRPHLEANRLLGNLAWRAEKVKSLFTGKKSPLTKESARVAQGHASFDNNKILNALPGFSFTPLEHTIRKACEQYHRYVSSHHFFP